MVRVHACRGHSVRGRPGWASSSSLSVLGARLFRRRQKRWGPRASLEMVGCEGPGAIEARSAPAWSCLAEAAGVHAESETGGAGRP